MKTLTLTRALNEIKLTEKKINDVAEKNTGWTVITKNGKITSGRYSDVDNFNSTVKANKDKIITLIAYRHSIKKALLDANNNTMVKIAGTEMSIAQAIDRKSFATMELSLYREILSDVNKTQSIFDREQTLLNQKIDALINTALEGDGKKDPEVVKGIEKSVRENNNFVVEDKSKITDWVRNSIEQLEEFLNEVDFVLSEVNAKTTIEVAE